MLLLLAVAWGCGSGGSNSFVDASGKHQAGWYVANAGGAHTAAFGQDANACQQCHGSDYTGGISKVSCFSASFNGMGCHAAILDASNRHAAGWVVAGTGGAHPAAFLDNSASCRSCHGSNYTGGPSRVSCFSASLNGISCHPNGPGGAPHVVPFPAHSASARSNPDFCLTCHRVDTSVTTVENTLIPACLSCHISDPTATPTGCASCHAPPPNGTTYPNKAGVHGSHSGINLPAGELLCDECHNGLGGETLDHLNRSRARTASVQANAVVFGTLAKTGGLAPTFTLASQSCSNTYCHGNGAAMDKPATAVLTPSWQSPFLTGVAANDCTKCHGYPPTTSVHAGATPTACIGCHPHVNASGTGFSDPTKHINGVIDASGGHAVPFFAHNAVADPTCLKGNGGCHNTGIGGSGPATQYPLARDAVTGAPDCMSCHTGADPLGAGNGLGNCKSCHGSGGTLNLAAPTGTAWPNIKLRHPTHHGAVCGTCHPGVNASGYGTQCGSGSGVNHGPNKSMLSGTIQTNTVQTTTGIVVNVPRGTSATCTHGSLIVTGCHDGPGTRVW